MRLILLALVLVAIAGCEAPKPIDKVVGDRHVQITAGGLLRSGDENGRYYYIIKDADTGSEYLAIVDAGIIKLDPKPHTKVEQ